MTAAFDRKLTKDRSSGSEPMFDLVTVAGVGLVGSFAAQVATPRARRVIVVDDDQITSGTTVLAPYPRSHLRRSKARTIARFLTSGFGNLAHSPEVVGVNSDIRMLGAGFWRQQARVGKAVLISCLDNVESSDYALEMARMSGIPAVAASVGRSGIEVLAFPADRAQPCYKCLGLSSGTSRPCLSARSQAPPTNSTPGIGSISAGLAVELAGKLVAGEIAETLDVRIAIGPRGDLRAVTARVQRARDCSGHEEPAEPQMSLNLPTSRTWSDIAVALGDPQATLLLDSLPPIEPGMPEAEVPLNELGVPFWAVLSCRVAGQPALIELTGDAPRLGFANARGGIG
jgi:hypothetical protein